MPSEHEFINNIYSYLETKKEIVFCRIEYSVFHGIIFSKINNSNLYIYNKIIKNIQGEDGESWKGFILESNLKEKEILTISNDLIELSKDKENVLSHQHYVHYYKRQNDNL